jgi:hypothetical protein
MGRGVERRTIYPSRPCSTPPYPTRPSSPARPPPDAPKARGGPRPAGCPASTRGPVGLKCWPTESAGRVRPTRSCGRCNGAAVGVGAGRGRCGSSSVGTRSSSCASPTLPIRCRHYRRNACAAAVWARPPRITQQHQPSPRRMTYPPDCSPAPPSPAGRASPPSEERTAPVCTRGLGSPVQEGRGLDRSRGVRSFTESAAGAAAAAGSPACWGALGDGRKLRAWKPPAGRATHQGLEATLV